MQLINTEFNISFLSIRGGRLTWPQCNGEADKWLSEYSPYTLLTLATKYGSPTVRPHCHQMAVHCGNLCVCLCVCACALSNRWSNLILVSFLPHCPLGLAVRWWCYLGSTSTLSASFLESAPPITLPHPDLPPDLLIHPHAHWSGKGSLSRWSCSQFTWDRLLPGSGNGSENNSMAFTVSRGCTNKLETDTVRRCEPVKSPERVWCCDLCSFWSKLQTYINSDIDTYIMPDLIWCDLICLRRFGLV